MYCDYKNLQNWQRVPQLNRLRRASAYTYELTDSQLKVHHVIVSSLLWYVYTCTHIYAHTCIHVRTHLLIHVNREDNSTMNNLLDAIRTNYNERYDEIRKRWGGGIMGAKAQAVKAKIEKVKAKELASKMSA